MVTKKLFALASVSAIAGLMTAVSAAGCSSTTTETTAPGDSGTDAKTDAKGDAKVVPGDDESDQAADCPQNVPLTTDDLDKEIGWKAAKATPNACTSTEITKIESNFKDTNIKTYFDLGNGVSDACKACVFA